VSNKYHLFSITNETVVQCHQTGTRNSQRLNGPEHDNWHGLLTSAKQAVVAWSRGFAEKFCSEKQNQTEDFPFPSYAPSATIGSATTEAPCLPCACATRQTPESPRQKIYHVLHMANGTRQSSAGKDMFAMSLSSGTWQSLYLVSKNTWQIFFYKNKKTDFKNSKIIILIRGRPHCSATPARYVPSCKSRHFSRYAAGGIRTRGPWLACNILYRCNILSLVFILRFSPTYYTKPSVNCLFEPLNDFKLKSCQLESFITFRDLQLSFWLFPHPRSFTKFKIHFAVC